MPIRNEFYVVIGKVYNLSITTDKKGSPYNMIMLLLAPVPPVKPNLFRQLNLNVLCWIVVEEGTQLKSISNDFSHSSISFRSMVFDMYSVQHLHFI